MKEPSNKVVDTIFSMFGAVYRRALQELVLRGPDAMYTAFVGVINEARKRSGMPADKTLAMLKVLKKVLDKVIESEGG